MKLTNQVITDKIYIIRGIQVMIDTDLATLYVVETKVLNQAVKRNINRFPSDFMFQLSSTEKDELVTNCDHLSALKYSSTNPYAFTEQGVSMLSAVLKSQIAIDISIQIMRAFTKLKNIHMPYIDIIRRVEAIETDNKETKELLSKVIKAIVQIQELQNETNIETKKIGFARDDK